MQKEFLFSVSGMSCVSCAKRVETNIAKISGVKFVSINIATEKGYVIADETVSLENIKNAVTETGYKFSEEVPDENIIALKFQIARKNLLLTAAFSTPLIILMFIHMFGSHIPKFVYLEFLISAIVLFYCAKDVLKNAVIAVSHFHSNMDTLVSIGAISAFLTTLLNIFGLKIASFGALSSMLILFHLIGRYIEAKLKYNAAIDIRKLMKLQSKYAIIKTENGIIKAPIDVIKIGNEIIVTTGDRIPVDGKIINGDAYIDESMLTGEALPIYKTTGDNVLSGTLINSGNINVLVEKVGKDTFLNKLIKLIDETQTIKIPLQAIADRIIVFFAPTIFILAIISAMIWYINYDALNFYFRHIAKYLPWANANINNISMAIFVFITILVISCPCALGLAIPLTLTRAAGLAAKCGLILKSAEAIQSAKDIEYIIFDKTGTLTEGKPQVIYSQIDNYNLNIAAQLEKYSHHPLAAAIIDFAASKKLNNNIEFTELSEIPGSGISAKYNNNQYFIGKIADIDNSKYLEYKKSGCTLIGFYENNTIKGFFAARDKIRDDAKYVIDELKKIGIQPVIATGDNKIAANAIARILDINLVFAELTPQEKLQLLKNYKAQNKKIAMVGDGINDAAALKIADVSIALGAGADISIEAADIILVKNKLSGILDALNIARTTRKKIKQNLFYAFIYNIIAIPVAMSGLLHPVIAEIAMFASSINIILNSKIKKAANNYFRIF